MNKNIFSTKAFKIINLFIKNANQPLHGRKIARKLGFNQKTTQTILNNLTGTVLIKRTYGRSYLYWIDKRAKKYVEMAENYKAIKLMQDFEVRNIVGEIITKRPIIVFGSYAKGYQNKDSDLDILVFEKVPDIPDKYIKKIQVLTTTKREFEKGIQKNESFPNEVLLNHVVIHGVEYIVDLWLRKYGQDKLV